MPKLTTTQQLFRKAALNSIGSSIPTSDYFGHTGNQLSHAMQQYKHVLPTAGLGGVAGGIAGSLLGDPVAGAGGGAGLVLGGAGGGIAGTGIGSLAALVIGRRLGKSPLDIQKMMTQWGSGGRDIGTVLGSLWGGHKGVRVARGLVDKEEPKTAATRVLVKMAVANLPVKPDIESSLANLSPFQQNVMRRQRAEKQHMAGSNVSIESNKPFVAMPKADPEINKNTVKDVNTTARRGRDKMPQTPGDVVGASGITPPAVSSVREKMPKTPGDIAGASGIMPPPITSTPPSPPGLNTGADALPPIEPGMLSKLKTNLTPGLRGKLLIGGGLAGLGLAGAGLGAVSAGRAANAFAGEVTRDNREQADYKTNRNFLQAQNEIELERQRTMLKRLQYPSLYGSV